MRSYFTPLFIIKFYVFSINYSPACRSKCKFLAVTFGAEAKSIYKYCKSGIARRGFPAASARAAADYMEAELRFAYGLLFISHQ